MEISLISNDQQLRATQRALEEQRASLASLNAIDAAALGIDPLIIRAQRASTEALVKELEDKIGQYQLAKEGDPSIFAVSSIEKLGEALVAARISRGWTQKQLGSRLGLKEQQIQRYEKERYRMASLQRLADIAKALEVELNGRLVAIKSSNRVRNKDLSALISDVPLTCFPIREMAKRGWIASSAKSPVSDELTRKAIRGFFLRSGLHHAAPMLNRRTGGSSDDQTRCSLLAWQARVHYRAIKEVQKVAAYHGISGAVLLELAKMTANEGGPLEAVKALRDIGVVVVFEHHLPRTHLDGAAMLLATGHPCIGLTLRQDRADNFWFVLFHELGHILRHRNCGLAEGFLDEEEETGGVSGMDDPREREANEFALNALIPAEKWRSSFVRYAKSKNQIAEFASAMGIGAEIVAGRLRKERQDFTLFSDMVGRGTIRRMFIDAGLFGGSE